VFLKNKVAPNTGVKLKSLSIKYNRSGSERDMVFKNDSLNYGLISVIFHWLIVIGVFGLFGLGLWMDDLTYYDSWYKTAPDLHRSFGVIVVSLMVLRLVWRLVNPAPKALPTHSLLERRAAHIAHAFLYVLVISMFFTGYLITTAKGQALYVFDVISLPAIVTDVEGLEDLAGEIHEWIAFTIIAIVGLHIAGALKHHFKDKDKTLIRMLGIKGQ
jgi:cytochrome b561